MKVSCFYNSNFKIKKSMKWKVEVKAINERKTIFKSIFLH